MFFQSDSFCLLANGYTPIFWDEEIFWHNLAAHEKHEGEPEMHTQKMHLLAFVLQKVGGGLPVVRPSVVTTIAM